MRPRNGEFGIFKRKVGDKAIFYYWTYDESGKRYYKSTGKLNWDEAVKYCRSLQLKGLLLSSSHSNFLAYFKDFFLYDECPYISDKLQRGYSYSKTWAQKQRTILSTIIMPEFKDTIIKNISALDLERFVKNLSTRGINGKTRNHVIAVIKAMFGYAQREGVIEINPAEKLRSFFVITREKGTLSKEELTELFKVDKKSNLWPNDRHYLLNYVAAATGMRLGEILALRMCDIHDYRILVSHSWNSLDGLKGTKTGKTRVIPIGQQLFKALDRLSQSNQTEFIFSASNGKQPYDHKTVYRYFWQALGKIGIKPDIKEKRNISFHSYRHTFNTLLLESGMNPETVRLITGHSAKMTAHYSHLQIPALSFDNNVVTGLEAN
ncbi:tyrosine-type recombinase/integrase [Treponema primitia]|uniref:tyrosine-type recombinase/integrase n=1 Tax=Treponema primitia TaxID=88058 RepID=UPI0002554E41|nr:site-specific integrase [Treponema primitia]